MVANFAARQRSRDAVEVAVSTVLLSVLLVLLLVGASMDRRGPSPRTFPGSPGDRYESPAPSP